MSKLDTWIDNKIVQNIVIWLFLLLIFSIIIYSETKFLASLSIIGFMIPPVYINSLLILPLFIRKNKLIGIMAFILNILLFTIIGVYLTSTYVNDFEWRLVYNLIGIMILILFFSTALKITRDSFQRRQNIKEAELKLLKAQLNPHFLFNTLNNLYGLSVIKSDNLPSLMLKLSDLLRYSLYETRDAFVSFEKEIKYLENYISLERIRLEDDTSILMNKKGDFSSLSIAPMLLIVFVENAFKHLGKTKLGKSEVRVDIEALEDKVSFKVTNTIDKKGENDEELETGKSGIGLVNAKKRLKLIYPENYLLKTGNQNEEYFVTLELKNVK